MNTWPHAPAHLLQEVGIYMVTCGTYLKVHHFRSEERLKILHDALLANLREAGWTLHAWAILSNHYHFVAQSPKDPKTLKGCLQRLHRYTAIKINAQDRTIGRKVWHEYWDTHITHHTSYLARLHYVHKNPVRHGLCLEASLYPWCSAAAFELYAEKSFVKSIYSFKIDNLNVYDDF